jgi:putative endonuclease
MTADDQPMDEYRDHVLGRAGERAAERWLIRRGWRILATGWRGAGGEIDIVAERRGILAACEVKTRTHHDPHMPPIRPAQRERLARAALAYVGRHPGFAQHAIRPDLIVVVPRGAGWHITRIEDITPDAYSNNVRRSP